MTRRYYYDDALAAAWMAKHFEVRFIDGIIGDPLWPEEHLHTGSAQFCIHPDSLPILEPRVGDLIDGIRIGYVEDVDGNELSVDVHGGTWEMDSDKVKIIQRDGEAFIWPLVEEV